MSLISVLSQSLLRATEIKARTKLNIVGLPADYNPTIHDARKLGPVGLDGRVSAAEVIGRASEGNACDQVAIDLDFEALDQDCQAR